MPGSAMPVVNDSCCTVSAVFFMVWFRGLVRPQRGRVAWPCCFRLLMEYLQSWAVRQAGGSTVAGSVGIL